MQVRERKRSVILARVGMLLHMMLKITLYSHCSRRWWWPLYLLHQIHFKAFSPPPVLIALISRCGGSSCADVTWTWTNIQSTHTHNGNELWSGYFHSIVWEPQFTWAASSRLFQTIFMWCLKKSIWRYQNYFKAPLRVCRHSQRSSSRFPSAWIEASSEKRN